VKWIFGLETVRNRGGNLAFSRVGADNGAHPMVPLDPGLTPPLWHRVRGRSMTPALLEGDEVALVLSSEPVTTGDVVVARGARGNLVIHRVVAVASDAIITRGDACAHDDHPVPPSQILLRALAIRRDGRTRPIPPPAPALLGALRSTARRFLASLRAVPGRWSRARRSCSTSRGGASWA
jgi:hypothetical protein